MSIYLQLHTYYTVTVYIAGQEHVSVHFVNYFEDFFMQLFDVITLYILVITIIFYLKPNKQKVFFP